MNERFDAVVIGAGHNGLVAAGYLARAGLAVAVVERREAIGGATITEELSPGFRVSAASYSLSLLRPDVYEDLDLARHGLDFYAKEPQMFVPFPDGRHFFVWGDRGRTAEEIGRIHGPDSAGYLRWSSFWDETVPLLRPLIDDPEPPPLSEVENRLPAEVWKLAVAGSAAECVSEFFESDEVSGAFASQGLIGTRASPHAAGTAWVLAYHLLGGELAGGWGTWSYVRGGMGSVSQALASAAREAGAEIIVGFDVSEIIGSREGVQGVRSSDGRTLQASVVLAGSDPKRTFLELVPTALLDDEVVEKARSWRTDGCVVKANFALAELPDFVAFPGTAPGPQHTGTVEISPSIGYLEAAFKDAEAGSFSTDPFMEVFIQTASDPTLVDGNGHVLSAFTQFAPEQTSDDLRGEAFNRITAALNGYAPNFSDSILASDVLTSFELESRFGLTGGDIFHGSILPEQSFAGRFSYRTQLRGLYLCGSGASPGGGVMGAAGRNAARVALGDRAGLSP